MSAYASVYALVKISLIGTSVQCTSINYALAGPTITQVALIPGRVGDRQGEACGGSWNRSLGM